MWLYGAIQKLEPQDDGTVRVHGIATSEAVDDEGEIVRADAMRAAIPDYMRFPALREMHQLSAAGTTVEAEVDQDGMTRIVAHVVDPVAVTKVKNQVYRGFSIGGRVTQRDPGNPKAITGLVLNEISLVDRPANPEAVYDCWKAALALQEHRAFNAPIQIWACNVHDHRHFAKAEALKCIEKRAAGQAEARISDKLSGDRDETGHEVHFADDGGRGSEKPSLAMGPNRSVTLAKAGFSPGAQMLMDIALVACEECMKLGSLSADQEQAVVSARAALVQSGANSIDGAVQDDAADPKREMLGVIFALLGKEQSACQIMMDMAHDCISRLSEGTLCAEAEKSGPAYSPQTMEQLGQAHDHLVAAGVRCDAARVGDAQPMSGSEQRNTASESAAEAPTMPAATGDTAEKALLTKLLTEIVPALDRLSKHVDDIARTPLPPLTIAKGAVAVSKERDRGSASDRGLELSTEAIASAFAKLSKEEQTLTLIKASYANPIRIIGSATER